MKKSLNLFIVAFLLATISFAQSNSINYKAIIKDGSGNILANHSIGVQFNILKDVTIVYTETHNPTTDANGLVILNIGDGTTSDTFTDIVWGSDNHSLKVFVDIGAGLVDMGPETQFMAVPYAKFAENAITEINNLTDAKTVDRSIYLGNGSGNTDDGNNNKNTALGFNSLKNNSNGIQNVAIGESTLLSNTSGERNTVVGQSAMRNNSTGNRNTVIGEDALYSNHNGSGNVAIGNNAAYDETGSNKLYIENSLADSNDALIYGEFDTNILRINGELQVHNPNPSYSGYAFPTTDGLINQVLQTDGDGQIFFVDPTSIGGGTDNQTIDTFSFDAATKELTLEIESDDVDPKTVDLSSLSINDKALTKATMSSSTQSVSAGNINKVSFNSIDFDLNSNYSTGSRRFTSSIAGYYRINTTVRASHQGSGSPSLTLELKMNGNAVKSNYFKLEAISRSFSLHEVVFLDLNDYVEIFCGSNNVPITIYGSNVHFIIEQIR